MTDKAYATWKTYHGIYCSFDVAIALLNLASDYRVKYDMEDAQVQKLSEVLMCMKDDAKDNDYAAIFYDVLYSITKRYKENKVW